MAPAAAKPLLVKTFATPDSSRWASPEALARDPGGRLGRRNMLRPTPACSNSAPADPARSQCRTAPAYRLEGRTELESDSIRDAPGRESFRPGTLPEPLGRRAAGTAGRRSACSTCSADRRCSLVRIGPARLTQTALELPRLADSQSRNSWFADRRTPRAPESTAAHVRLEDTA